MIALRENDAHEVHAVDLARDGLAVGAAAGIPALCDFAPPPGHGWSPTPLERVTCPECRAAGPEILAGQISQLSRGMTATRVERGNTSGYGSRAIREQLGQKILADHEKRCALEAARELFR
jgi:hypothetical protein